MGNRSNLFAALFVAGLMVSGIIIAVLPDDDNGGSPNPINDVVLEGAWLSVVEVTVVYHGYLDTDNVSFFNPRAYEISFLMLGTGFIISFGDGVAVMTNAHVVVLIEGSAVDLYGETYNTDDYIFDEPLYYCNLYAHDSYEMTVDTENYADLNKDLALMFFSDDEDTSELKYLEFGSKNSIRRGDTVFTIGNSKGEGLSFASGTVRSVSVSMNSWIEGQGRINVMSMNIGIYHGNSGGPLINEAGLVIGVVSAGMMIDEDKASILAYAVPVDTILKFLDSI